MQRDDDYVRELMFEFEDQPDWLILLPELIAMSADQRRKQHHVHLLVDAGMVAPVGKGTYRLTNRGHDFLAAIRDEGIWARTKAAVAESGGSATLEMLKALAAGFIRSRLPTEPELSSDVRQRAIQRTAYSARCAQLPVGVCSEPE